ncbi:hypothetical protein I6G55_22300 [Burkholderia oklahomensis]|nr:hypothetical protein [Burkholderia oklahomensis]
MDEAGEKPPCLELGGELFAIANGTQQVSLDREVLSDRAEVRPEHLSAFGIAETLHSAFAFSSRAVTVFGPVVDADASLATQTERELEIPAYRVADNRRRETMTMVKRFRLIDRTTSYATSPT